jgi:RNA polymerase primary sigma factor
MVIEKTDRTAKKSSRQGEGDPVLGLYLDDISSSTPLSASQEADLARRIREGHEDARNTLVEANLRFVVSVSKDYQNRGLGLTELISAGNMGLIIAAERFDETKGYKFISYAVWWIRQSILQTLSEQSTIRVPVNRLDMMAKITRSMEALNQEGAAPSVAKVADSLGFTEIEVERTMVDIQPIRSLDAPFDTGEDHCMMDCLPNETVASPEQVVLDSTRTEDIQRVLGGLKDREAEVLRLYFGLGYEPPLTLDQIGTRFKLTRERVRQIKEIALTKLRHPRFFACLRAYMEN